jgi:nicotinamidase/pyrazinamidase
MNDWIAPSNVALVTVDVQNTFCPANGKRPDGNLPVGGGHEIIAQVNENNRHFKKRVFTKDAHCEGHASFASTHGKQPFSVIMMKDGAEVAAGTEGAVVQVLWPDHGIKDTEDGEFHDDLEIAEGSLILEKGTNPLVDSYSAFFENDGVSKPTFEDGTTMTEKMKSDGVDTLVFQGLAGDFCVGWNALDARKEGFRVIVLWDATRSIKAPARDPEGNIIPGKTTEDVMLEQLQAAGVEVINSADLPRVLGIKLPKPEVVRAPSP